MDGHDDLVTQLADTADRLDELADIADLMGDDAAARRFRSEGSRCRDRAMRILDAAVPPDPGGQTRLGRDPEPPLP